MPELSSSPSSNPLPSTPLSTPAQIIGLLFWLALCFATSALGVLASITASDFYTQQLIRPTWSPPPTVFGPVWTVLYVMMAIAAWLVWRRSEVVNTRLALSLFLAQLVCNALWSWLFFAWRLGALAFVDIVALWALIIATIVTFWRISKLASCLLIPYWLWVSFATALSFTLWQNNPRILGV